MIKRLLIFAAFLLFSSTAFCQIPVTDVLLNAQTATNSAAELASMAKQLAEAIKQYQMLQAQYQQAQQTYAAITGGRGFDLLLNNQLQAYMPADIAAMQTMAISARNGYGGSSPQGKAMAALYKLNSILSPTVLAGMTIEERQIIYSHRDHTAILASSSELAFARAQQRAAHLQALQSAIKTATDPAAKAELAVAIAVHQTALANEQLQMQALASSSRAEELAMRRRMDEQRIANIGRGADLKHTEF